MFLSEDEQTCLQNLKIFKDKWNRKQFQAIKVKVNGEGFFVKDFAIDRLGLSFSEYKELAIKYWSQDQNSTEKTKEILFVGDVEVIEVLDEYLK